MRSLALLSAVAVTASLAVAIPGSVSEEAALASTPPTCESMHDPAKPALLDGSTDTYVIDSVQELVYLSDKQDENVPGTTDPWRTKNFVQTASIDLDGCLWAPIGTSQREGDNPLARDNPFTGEYNGAGNSIRNLTISAGEYLGLFGYTDGATITGVHLLDADLKQAGRFSGTLVGQALRTTISDSSATGSISAINADAVGGLVGQAFVSTSISRSFSTVTVTRASGYGDAFGGLVGALGGEPGGSSIESSFATGAVSAGDKTGGLAGEVGGTSTISNSYARGAVTGGDKVGGLIGALLRSANLTVTNSYATGKVSGASAVGGLIGGKFDNETPTVTNSFWDKETTEQNVTLDNKGSGKETTALKTLSTFFEGAGWPIVDGWESFDPDPNNGKVWGILADLNGGYPYLLWEYEADPFACGPLVDGFHQVSTPEQLRAVGIRGEESPCGLGDNYRQVNNIDLAGTGPWTPIGGIDLNTFQEVPFTGHYDGGDHTIHNMSIESGGTLIPSSGIRFPDPQGFFGLLEGATVERLTFQNASIGLSDAPESGAREAVPVGGILAGWVSESDISQLTVSGEMSDLDFVSGGLVGLVIPGYSDPSNPTTITDCTVDVQMESILGAEITLGGVVGAVVSGGNLELARCAVDVKTARPGEPGEPVERGVSFADQPQFESILFAAENTPRPGLPAYIGGAVGGLGPGSHLTLDAVSITAGSSIGAIQAEDAPSLVDAIAVGGLVGASYGTMTITNSSVGSPPTIILEPDEDDLVVLLARAESAVYLGGLVGVVQGNETAKIVGSSATTEIDVFLPDGVALIGGLGGSLENTEVEQSVWDGDISGGTIDGFLVAGGVAGIIEGEDSFIRYSNSRGSIYVGYRGENVSPTLVAGGSQGRFPAPRCQIRGRLVPSTLASARTQHSVVSPSQQVARSGLLTTTRLWKGCIALRRSR